MTIMKSEEEKRKLFWEEFRRELGKRLRPKAKKITETLVECSQKLKDKKWGLDGL